MTMKSIEARISQLEEKVEKGRKEASFWRLAALILLICLGVTALYEGQFPSAAAPKEDIQGNVFVRDNKGTRRIFLGMIEDAAGFAMYDNTGKPRLTMRVNPDGSAGIQMYDKEKQKRVSMGINAQGAPGIILYNDSKKAIWSIP
jgi:hypothetical protein